jgi:hypothetical protein
MVMILMPQNPLPKHELPPKLSKLGNCRDLINDTRASKLLTLCDSEHPFPNLRPSHKFVRNMAKKHSQHLYDVRYRVRCESEANRWNCKPNLVRYSSHETFGDCVACRGKPIQQNYLQRLSELGYQTRPRASSEQPLPFLYRGKNTSVNRKTTTRNENQPTSMLPSPAMLEESTGQTIRCTKRASYGRDRQRPRNGYLLGLWHDFNESPRLTFVRMNNTFQMGNIVEENNKLWTSKQLF